jgi:hypothetical protein
MAVGAHDEDVGALIFHSVGDHMLGITGQQLRWCFKPALSSVRCAHSSCVSQFVQQLLLRVDADGAAAIRLSELATSRSITCSSSNGAFKRCAARDA